MFNATYIFSQSCANYAVTRTTGNTYTTLVGNNPSNFIPRSISGGATNDDNRTYPTPIGFDFWYLGVRYINFSASLNGFMDFSSNTHNGTNSGVGFSNVQSDFSNGGTATTTLALAPYLSDTWTGSGGNNPFSSSLIYKTTGTAPNRVLTVEWINLDEWASPAFTIPANLNFQIKLFESTGVIQYNYGTMSAGNAFITYVCGINGGTPSATPSAAQLLVQQTPNTTTFSNTPQINLPTIPSGSSTIIFTPPAPSASPSSLSFSAIAITSAVINWTDNASNELGYVLYNSTDGSNFNFVTQLAANSVSAGVTGLLPNTSYTWQVYAVTEGRLSAALTGTMLTLAAGTITSVATGNWNTPATWNCTCIPTDGDFVTIANSHNVTIDANAICYEITVGQGASGQLTIGNDGTTRNFSVTNNINVQSGGTVIVNSTAATHSLIIKGNIINNGIFNLAPSATRVCNAVFNKNGNQSISGTGAVTNFNLMTIDLGLSVDNILEVTSTNFSVLPANFLTLLDGTFKLSTASTETLFTAATTMNPPTRIWANHPGANLMTGNSVTLFGSLKVSSGLLTIGDAANENLISHVGNIAIDGGTLNIAGRLTKLGLTSLTNLDLSSGLLTVCTVGSTTASEPVFKMDEKGSTFNMSGGRIVIQRPGVSNLGYLNTGGNVGSVTGGTLQIGNSSTPASQTIQINSSIPIFDLLIGDGVAVQAALSTNSLVVKDDIVINTGTLNANAVNMSVARTWNNSGTFSGSTASVTLNGTAAQQIRGISTTTFNNLTINNSSGTGVTLLIPANVSGALTLTNGKIFTDNTNILSMLAGSTSGSGNANSFVDGPMNKVGNTAFTFPTGSGTRWARIGIGAPSVTSTFKAQYFPTIYSSTVVAATPTPALERVSQKEYWELDRSSGAGSAAVTLFWENNNFSGIFDCSSADLRIAHWDGTGSAWENTDDVVITSGSCSGGTSGSVSTSTALSVFSPFTFGSRGSSNNPLPITLLSFDAFVHKSEVLLKWSTASEINCNYFTVEKSSDGVQYEELIRIKGAGNSTTRRNYATVDKKPFQNISYYRLKQTDFDSKFYYSKVEVINFSDEIEYEVYPNPNNGSQINIQIKNISSPEVQITLYDSNGRTVFSKAYQCKNKNGDFNIVSNFETKLNAGIYFVKASNEKEIFKKKLVVLAD